MRNSILLIMFQENLETQLLWCHMKSNLDIYILIPILTELGLINDAIFSS